MNSKNVATGKLKLVSGPSRGGKSRWAEHLLKEEKKVVYIATLDINEQDENLKNRIIKHKKRRPKHWKLIEGSNDLDKTIENIDNSYSLLIDSLGGYVYSYLKLNDEEWNQQQNKLSSCLSSQNRLIIIVIEETGWGIVPITSDGNLFRDRLGLLAQIIENFSIESWLVIQGRAIDLHKISTPVI